MAQNDKRPGVLLLGAEETPALPVIWSLARQRVPVTVASKRRICTGLFSRHPVKRLVYEGPSAYSSLTAGKDGTVYLLFERGEKKLYESIAVARFSFDWLTGERD